MYFYEVQEQMEMQGCTFQDYVCILSFSSIVKQVDIRQSNPNVQSRMYNVASQATFGTGHSTKTNKKQDTQTTSNTTRNEKESSNNISCIPNNICKNVIFVRRV